jgi:hypothetical protein
MGAMPAIGKTNKNNVATTKFFYLILGCSSIETNETPMPVHRQAVKKGSI